MKNDDNLNTTVRLINDEIASKTSICSTAAETGKATRKKNFENSNHYIESNFVFFCQPAVLKEVQKREGVT